MSSLYSSWRKPDSPLQKRLLSLIDAAGHQGLTVHEAYNHFDTTNVNSPQFAHHGWISGALSVLHGDLRIARLSEKREGCKVYVHPDFLDNRRAEAQGSGRPSKEEVEWLRSLDSFLEYWMQVDTEGSRFGTDRTKAQRNQRLFFSEISGIWEQRP